MLKPADHSTKTLSTAKALEYMILLGFLPFENLLMNSLLEVEILDSRSSGVLSCFSVRQCFICGEPVEPVVDLEFSTGECSLSTATTNFIVFDLWDHVSVCVLCPQQRDFHRRYLERFLFRCNVRRQE